MSGRGLSQPRKTKKRGAFAVQAATEIAVPEPGAATEHAQGGKRNQKPRVESQAGWPAPRFPSNGRGGLSSDSSNGQARGRGRGGGGANGRGQGGAFYQTASWQTAQPAWEETAGASDRGAYSQGERSEQPSGGRGGWRRQMGRGNIGGVRAASNGVAMMELESPQRAPVAKVREPAQAVTERTGGSGSDPAFMTKSRFDSLPVSAATIKALHSQMGYETMTIVQAETLPIIMEGHDVLAKAKTGTGKTLAFLIPAVEAILQGRASRQGGAMRTRNGIEVLVISPTRELAQQIEKEAATLLKFHNLQAKAVFGGTNMNAEKNRLRNEVCDVLVATPGRLIDHLENTPDMAQRLQGLRVLVLDEADHLLEMGFRPSIEKILRFLPAARQTLLFSATIPQGVHKVANLALRQDHKFIDTVGEETEETNIQVRQEFCIVPMEEQLSAIATLLKKHMQEEPEFKVLVFCVTARITGMMAELFGKLGFPAREIHSRKSQSFRTKVSDEFRRSNRLVLFTSDVSARGVDYPDVTLVMQLGVPSDKAQYIHRLGRTARAGKEGLGLLILAEHEKFFLRELSDLPITDAGHLGVDPAVQREVKAALGKVDRQSLEQAYQAWLGFYNSVKGLKMDKATLVQYANFYSQTLGMAQPPVLLKRTVGKMGLKGVPGLLVQ